MALDLGVPWARACMPPAEGIRCTSCGRSRDPIEIVEKKLKKCYWCFEREQDLETTQDEMSPISSEGMQTLETLLGKKTVNKKPAKMTKKPATSKMLTKNKKPGAKQQAGHQQDACLKKKPVASKKLAKKAATKFVESDAAWS